MKQLTLVLFVAALLTACKGNDKKITHTEKNDDGTTTTTSVDVKGMTTDTDEMTKKTEELKKLTPLTLDQLKALLPEEVNGMKRTNFNANSAMGYAIAEGEYQQDENTSLKLVIYDCAGEAGAGWYSLTYWGAMNFQQESDKEYTKTIDFKGVKAIENFKKESKESSLTYVANERLLVVLTGRNMEPAALKEAAEKLNLKVS